MHYRYYSKISSLTLDVHPWLFFALSSGGHRIQSSLIREAHAPFSFLLPKRRKNLSVLSARQAGPPTHVKYFTWHGRPKTLDIPKPPFCRARTMASIPHNIFSYWFGQVLALPDKKKPLVFGFFGWLRGS